MSIPLEFADQIAADVIAQLEPHCEPGRCVVAGSVRRRKPQVGDVEIVCVPRMVSALQAFGDSQGLLMLDGFGKEALQRDPGFAAVVNQESWERVKGDDKYICRILHCSQGWLGDGMPFDVQLDIFCVSAFSWGYQLAIRTGSAEFSQHLALAWVLAGFKGIDGNLTRDSVPVPVPDEQTLFRLCGLDYVPPEGRG